MIASVMNQCVIMLDVLACLVHHLRHDAAHLEHVPVGRPQRRGVVQPVRASAVEPARMADDPEWPGWVQEGVERLVYDE